MKLLLQVMLLGGLCWLGYANMHMLDKATVAIRNARDNTGTKLQMSQVARYVQMEYIDQNVLPKGDLTRLIVAQLEADGRETNAKSGKDTWGNAYWATAAKGGFNIVSAGPDGKWRTKDDIYFYQSMGGLGAPGSASAEAAVPTAQTVAPKPAMQTVEKIVDVVTPQGVMRVKQKVKVPVTAPDATPRPTPAKPVVRKAPLGRCE